jgi:hypothetical protein
LTDVDRWRATLAVRTAVAAAAALACAMAAGADGSAGGGIVQTHSRPDSSAATATTDSAREPALRAAQGRPPSRPAGHVIRRARPALLGVNHHVSRNGGGVWDNAAHQPNPTAVAAMRRAHVSLVRYPGGTVANLFRWRNAIGDERACQVDGRRRKGGHRAIVGGATDGPDEEMGVVNAAGADPAFVVQPITETPIGAAN